MAKQELAISHVTDTAFWVASYRAEESLRPDALFRDPLAARLVGETGKKIADQMLGSKFTRWTLVIRTVIIDDYIKEAVAKGVDTILNLGAGLDTRPYRMALPKDLRWIEVDFESTIKFKDEKLKGEKPNCRLERISLDLANRELRTELFKKINSESKSVLVLTEGVIVYLSPEHVKELCEDLRSEDHFNYWVAEYLAPAVYSYLNNSKHKKQMARAPFRFFPPDWFGFFNENGWQPESTKYSVLESERLGRPYPMPLWAHLLKPFVSAKIAEPRKKNAGYMLLVPKRPTA